MQEMQQILEDYEMGFITITEALMRMSGVLSQVGAADALNRKMDECLKPLAYHMFGIIAGDGKSIEDFEAQPKPRAVRKAVVKKAM